MKAEVREMLGQAAHQAMVCYFDGKNSILMPSDWSWEGLDEETKELYRVEAEAAIKKLAGMLIVSLSSVLFTEEDIKHLLEDLV